MRETELRALLAVAVIEPGEDAGPGLTRSMLERAQELIRCDWVSFSDFDPRGERGFVDQDYPALNDELEDDGAFWRHYWDCPPCSYPSRSGDDRSVTMISDFYTLRQWHATGMYAEYMSHFGVEHEIMMCLPTTGDRTRRLLFARGAGTDFTEHDRLLLSLLRPHLCEAHRQLELVRRGMPNLTERQLQLLRLAATGHTNAEIAERLSLSRLTVRKHLENIFERLEVNNRTAAVAIAFPDGP